MTAAAAEHGTTRLSARMMALATMIGLGTARTGRDGFGGPLLADAEQVLSRVGDRLRLSADHTVVVLAGGTGSGKSSLFNKLAGADFSVVGVTRPVTREPHACVWGADGAGPLLDWLGVPARNMYLRASALDSGENDLAGMLLVDLPDHDSVLTGTGGVAERICGQADLLVWVLDPQKYADAAVHRDHLAPLAGHSEVLTIVLNHTDLLDNGQIDDCVSDLRRLLETEGLQDVQILVTSAVAGTGIDDLRKLLIGAVSARRATAARISADVDRMAQRFARFGGDLASTVEPGAMPAGCQEQLTDAFVQAAGVAAVVRSLRSALELRAVDFVGWPIAWLVQRLARRIPVRRIRLGSLWEELRSAAAGPSGSQQAEIDNALTDFSDDIARQLPRPWGRTVRTAIRSGADQIPVALGNAIGDSLPPENSVAWWWRMAGAWQGMLVGAAAVGAAWLLAVLVIGVLHAVRHAPAVLSDASLTPWIASAVAAALLLGWLTSLACMTWVRSAAEHEAGRVQDQMRHRIAAAVRELVIGPAEQELAEFRRFREELRIAAQAGHAADVQAQVPANDPAPPGGPAGNQARPARVATTAGGAAAAGSDVAEPLGAKPASGPGTPVPPQAAQV